MKSKSAVWAKVQSFGVPDDGEDIVDSKLTCDCCGETVVRRVWWWQGASERMNAWLCAGHVRAAQGETA